jgi:arylsulfatase A-like enzyme
MEATVGRKLRDSIARGRVAPLSPVMGGGQAVTSPGKGGNVSGACARTMRRGVVFVVLSVAALALVSCGGEQAPPKLNVVLISIDTLRPDHLGCYGYTRNTSPSVDAFARRGALFLSAVSHAPSTLPSHASILTSLNPSAHGAEFSTRHSLPDDWPTIAEMLAREGYRTGAFVAPGQMSKVFGLDQGFEIYDDQGGGVQAISKRATAWLDTVHTEPFFLFLHCLDVHAPYFAPTKFRRQFLVGDTSELPDTISIELLERINRGKLAFSEEDRQHVINMYDAGIHFTDYFIGRFLGSMDSLALSDQTVIILLSDHGEEFAEHGAMGMHSHTVYDELLRVPLIIAIPEVTRPGQTVPEMVRLIDVVPTILDVLGIEPPPTVRGRSLVPFLGDGVLPGEEPSIGEMEPSPTGKGRVVSVRTRRYKLIHDGPKDQYRLFDLLRDPLEANDVEASSPEVVERLTDVMDAYREEAKTFRQHVAGGDTVVVGGELRDQLKALGYLN